jgi:glycosyltransferase involved in cell wall biosynthesis
VLFYGQFIPLHGIETIVRAAQIMHNEPVRFVLIGCGQEEERIRSLLAQAALPALEWIRWVEYGKLSDWIQQADVCLGIFGDTEKAARVIPNKVYQIVSARKPLVTRDSPAMRELVGESEPGVVLVPPADPEALAAALRRQRQERSAREAPLYADLCNRITPAAIGRQALAVLQEVTAARPRRHESEPGP